MSLRIRHLFLFTAAAAARTVSLAGSSSVMWICISEIQTWIQGYLIKGPVCSMLGDILTSVCLHYCTITQKWGQSNQIFLFLCFWLKKQRTRRLWDKVSWDFGILRKKVTNSFGWMKLVSSQVTRLQFSLKRHVICQKFPQNLSLVLFLKFFWNPSASTTWFKTFLLKCLFFFVATHSCH